MDKAINKFRLASRELFNNFFLEEFLEAEDEDFYEQFTIIEEQLFCALVTTKFDLGKIVYGFPQPEILVKAKEASICGTPIMINREIDSGYWDYPISIASPECVFTFVKFFDWDQKSYKDNRYVRVIIQEWPADPDLVGKHALIETIYTSYNQA